jgi:hypothetical protein
MIKLRFVLLSTAMVGVFAALGPALAGAQGAEPQGAVSQAAEPQVAASQAADPQVYQYRVEHPLYGDIGTYTNIVTKTGDTADVETKLNVVVKMLGIVVHRQEAERVEHWQNDRLTLFRGVTETNGKPLEVDGEARGNSFVITSPAGTVTAPADVRPTNPWSPAVLNADVVMSTKSGRVFSAHLNDVKDEVVTADGKPERLRRFDVTTDKPQSVWLDDHNVPVAFRTVEDGTPIDFVLTRYPSGAPQPWAGPEADHPETTRQAAAGE